MGDPAFFLKNIGTGIRDILDPFANIIKGKGVSKFGKRLGKGIWNLIKLSTEGILNTFNKFIRSIMQILSTITTDSDFIKARSMLRNRVLRNYKEGIIVGT